MIVDGQIKCGSCGEKKPLQDFSASRAARGYGECRTCSKLDRKRHRDRDIEASKSSRRDHYRRNKHLFRDYNLSRYGITSLEYEAMLALQSGGCACCGAVANRTGKRLFVDHDHVTGAIRGIICHKCNAGIGALGDDAEGVRRALAYLERAQQSAPRTAPALRINLLQGAN